MALFRLLQRITTRDITILLALSLAAGFSNAAILAVVNEVLNPQWSSGATSVILPIGLGLALVYYFCQRHYMIAAAIASNRLVSQTRATFLAKLAAADFDKVEQISKAELTACINAEAQLIADLATIVTVFTQGAVVALVTIGYISYLSPMAALLSAVCVASITWLYVHNHRLVEEKYLEVLSREAEVAADNGEIVDGYKYLKLNPQKMNHALTTAITNVDAASGARIAQHVQLSRQFSITEASFMVMLCITIVGASTAINIDRNSLVSLATASCFLLGPITMIASAIPVIQRINTAAIAIEALGRKLSGDAPTPPPHLADRPVASSFLPQPITMIGSAIFPLFQRINTAAIANEALGRKLSADAPTPPLNPSNRPVASEALGQKMSSDAPTAPTQSPDPPVAPGKLRFDAVEYVYSSTAEHNRIGPFSFDIAMGEFVVIQGPNGSGKTTLVKVLTGLYRPTKGCITVGDRVIGTADLPAYRNLFSAIFVEDFLFRENCVLAAASESTVRDRLNEMGLAETVSFQNGNFSTRSLSTGQRKRLAMIEALVEDRPILVCDEWDDTQDIDFRDRFYTHLVPRLKNSGKTVIVVSHNAQYLELADRIIRIGARQNYPE